MGFFDRFVGGLTRPVLESLKLLQGDTTETVATVKTDIDEHIADAVGAHAATAIVVAATTITAIDVDGALDQLAGVGRTSETVKANAASIDALERSGSTIAVDGAIADAVRNVTLTMKDGNDVTVAGYHAIGVKVTDGDGAGADAGTNTPIAGAGLDTVDGLVVGASGEQISPSNSAAISDAGNASLFALTAADGTLTVQLNKDSGNDFFFVHFLLPDGSVASSAEIEMNNAG